VAGERAIAPGIPVVLVSRTGEGWAGTGYEDRKSDVDGGRGVWVKTREWGRVA